MAEGMYRYSLFSFIAFVAIFAVGAHAAPSVRMLGTNAATGNTNYIPAKTASTTTLKTTPASNLRPSSLRGVGTVRQLTGTTTKATATPVNRLSVGKYLHDAGTATGVIKPINSVETAQYSNRVSELVDKINALELDLSKKQDSLEIGDGLYVENNTLNVTPEISDLIDKIDALQITLAAKADADNYYTKEETAQLLQQQITEESDTIYDASAGERKYVGIVDTFDISVLD